MNAAKGLRGALAQGLVPAAARAECLGQGCYDGLGWLIGLAIAVGAALLAIAVYVIVLVFRRQWRKAGLIAGGTLLVVWLVGMSLA